MTEHDPSLPALETDDRSVAQDGGAAARQLGAGVGQRLLAAVTGASLKVTSLAILLAVVLGGLVVAFSDPPTRRALGYLGARPGDTFAAAWSAISRAYVALVVGAVGSPSALSETLVSAAPLILTGMAVAIPLRAGLFNIGGEGQVMAGGLVGGFVGFTFVGLPTVIHLPLAILAAAAGGIAIGWLPGFLKARTGAHEVISTIMLNNTMTFVTIWLLTTTVFQVPGRMDPISKNVAPSARFPRFSTGTRVDIGIVVAIAVAVAMYWLVERSTTGFELNAVGANPTAAQAAGMDANRATITAMATAGMLGGLAGAALVLGIQGRLTPGFSGGVGFDGITVALLGRGSIGGSVAAGLLLGAFKAGGRAMQARTGTSLDLVVVIQAFIIVLIAAPGLVRAVFRVRTEGAEGAQISKGWGG
jgi:general nucleoside transport system permease protein